MGDNAFRLPFLALPENISRMYIDCWHILNLYARLDFNCLAIPYSLCKNKEKEKKCLTWEMDCIVMLLHVF